MFAVIAALIRVVDVHAKPYRTKSTQTPALPILEPIAVTDISGEGG